jgi:hypothetical protein
VATDDRNSLARQRARAKEEVAEARKRGRDDAAMGLVDLVDDCDRAIDQMHSSNDHSKILVGVEQLRRRTIQRFEEVGLVPYGQVGDVFDPHLHEAISTEAGWAPDNSIIRVHRRGWQREDGKIVRTAMVTVCKGTPAGSPPSQGGPRRRTARVSDPVADAYVCPYGYPGCAGDCPNCRLDADIGERSRRKEEPR